MNPQPVQLLFARQIEDAEHRAEHAAVEGHSAVPQLQYVERMLKVVAKVIEQDVADASAEDDPGRGIEDKVVGVPARHRRAGLADQPEQIPIADEDAGEVRKAVPTKLEKAEIERHGIEP